LRKLYSGTSKKKRFFQKVFLSFSKKKKFVLAVNMTSLNEWIETKIKDGDINYFEYEEFTNMEKVGEGAFGVVNRADWKSGEIKVALKVLTRHSTVDEHNMKKFLKEVMNVFKNNLLYGTNINDMILPS
jgi:hypothetical protein